MHERPEEDFEDEDEELDSGEDVDRAMRDIDSMRRRGAQKGADPAWRRLERLREEKRTAELTSDFEDYDLGPEPVRAGRGKKR